MNRGGSPASGEPGRNGQSQGPNYTKYRNEQLASGGGGQAADVLLLNDNPKPLLIKDNSGPGRGPARKPSAGKDRLGGLEQARLASRGKQHGLFQEDNDPTEEQVARASLGWRAWLPAFCCSGASSNAPKYN